MTQSQHPVSRTCLSGKAEIRNHIAHVPDHTKTTADQESLYHQMIYEMRDYAFILLDPVGNIMDWNLGAEAIQGYTAAEAIGKHFSVFYTPEDREANIPEQLLIEAVKSGSVAKEGWRLRKNGERFWANVVITPMYNAQNNLTGFSKLTRDVTERKNTEDKLVRYAEELERKNEDLRLSEERYHRMISEVQDYAIILLSPTGFIEDWNVGAEAIKGYTASDIVGKHFQIFYTEEDKQIGLPETLLNKAATDGKATHEGWRVRKDGTKFWGSITITALHDSHQKLIGFSKVTRDLTEKKIAEDILHKKNHELETMNKELALMNQELSSFAYISSHDLQEPLRKIQTFTSRILELDRNAFSERSINYFQRIQSAAQRMRMLIDDLLSYSRANASDRSFVQVDTNEILQDVLNDLEAVIEESRAAIEWHNLPVLDAIPFQFHQLLFNLISNSLKFRRADVAPRIVIQCELIPAAKVPGETKRLDVDHQHFSITDNGIGFENKHSTKIFEIFQRLHGREQFTGTGVGLAICKKIVENHYGVILAEGNTQTGSTFHFYIPASLNLPATT